MMKKLLLVVLGLGIIAGLSSCGLTKEDLGMAKSRPDETQVSRRNQLLLPPDFDVRPAATTNQAPEPQE